MWIFLNEFNCLFETDCGQEVPCVLEILGFESLDHFANALYVFWILENFIKGNSFDLEVREITKISRGKDWFFLNVIVQNEKSVLLHESAQFRIISRPNNTPNFLSFVLKMLSDILFSTRKTLSCFSVFRLHIIERENTVDINDRESGAITVHMKLLRSASKLKLGIKLNVW